MEGSPLEQIQQHEGGAKDRRLKLGITNHLIMERIAEIA